MMLNGMSRAMGQHDFYPFALPHEAVTKLHFIHLLVLSSRVPDLAEPAPATAPPPSKTTASPAHSAATASQSQSQTSTSAVTPTPKLPE
jgi:hypothetical protein